MTDINWRAEALSFAKVHDSNRDLLIQIIEKAMRHGATLMVIETTKLISDVRDDLRKKHKQSAPHKQQTKLIQIEKL